MTGPLLLIRDADGSERTIELRDGVMRIGRAAGNEILLGDASKGVSRTHAELHIENGRCTIVDLHSQNGTWVNALRVQRAEVRPDAEIAIGVFRLRLQMGTTTTASTAGHARPQPATVIAPSPGSLPGVPRPSSAEGQPLNELPLHAAMATSPVPMPAMPQASAQPAPAAAPKRSRLPLIYGGIGAVAMIALAVALFSIPSKKLGGPAPGSQTQTPAGRTPAAQAPAGQVLGSAPPAAAPPPAAPVDAGAARSAVRPATRRATPSPPATPPAPRPPATGPARVTQTPPAPPSPARSSRPPDAAAGRAGSPGGRATEAVRTTANDLPVPRKPGESLQDWQQRGAALQARYAFAKVALDRGDFAAASGGFAAILLEEPGFLDAPQLLVKAREGLRVAAAEAIEAGNKLDAAGDWVNALRRYEQALEIDRAVPGLEEAMKRVRDKMRVAGLTALRRARQFDAVGRFADALTEYEKAAQWLSPEDPNQQIARGRADQLKARLK